MLSENTYYVIFISLGLLLLLYKTIYEIQKYLKRREQLKSKIYKYTLIGKRELTKDEYDLLNNSKAFDNPIYNKFPGLVLLFFTLSFIYKYKFGLSSHYRDYIQIGLFILTSFFLIYTIKKTKILKRKTNLALTRASHSAIVKDQQCRVEVIKARGLLETYFGGGGGKYESRFTPYYEYHLPDMKFQLYAHDIDQATINLLQTSEVIIEYSPHTKHIWKIRSSQ